ncbi:calcyphosin-like protein [Biomphalaria glabrata]|uniref:Calcyphosin-like protein n=2 Tax=Biomphalaria TaxID=6525 RepID=A0A2C9JQA4_BIOGL|nr:calcyphosin-like protein [Biomphalaria glabrata]XP_055886808.1 calcyphosin-like protein [Biomphalaria glabrata]XP_055886809.1 calcyphosin-like protein [Biomphalaria glabrata]KAK0062936.1 calcyphosin-like protein [Biomphalaria pfeifferi]KAI8749729.1 calcyphosin-like protein [Biomphalaria glabrata]KAI8787002.1 calcyphosin protein [Biomphalaria glabrata]
MADMGKLNEELKAKARVTRAHAKDPLELVQAQFLARGASGIKGAQMRFRIMDDDSNRKLSFEEFSKGMREVGVLLNKEQEIELFRTFDRDGEGTINFEEFLRAVQPKMNDRRKRLVEAAFVKMDKTGDGVVTVKDIAKAYNASKHPKYISGEWTETKVYQEFLKTFEAEGHVDGIVTLEEFLSYYSAISCSIDSDAYFDLMMRNSWGNDLTV